MSSRIDKLLDRGAACQETGDFAGAESAYREALSLSKNHSDALQLLGSLKIQTGSYDEARQYLSRAIGADRENAVAHLNLAGVELKTGNFHQAKEAAMKAAALAPDAPQTKRQLAIAAEKAGDSPLAARAYRSLIGQPGGQPNDILKTAVHELHAGHVDRADEMIKQAVQSLPKSSSVLAVWASVAEAKLNWPEMIAVAKEWLAINSKNEQARETLARAQLEAGDSIGAMNTFVPLLSRDGEIDGPRSLIYGRICLIAQRFDDAEKYIDQALSALPDNPDAHFAKSRISTFRGDIDAAIDHCERALAIKADHSKALVHLVSLRKGAVNDHYAANIRSLWERAQPDVEDHASLGFALGDIAYRAKEADTAIDFYHRANAMRAEYYAKTGDIYEHEVSERETRSLISSANELLAIADLADAPSAPRMIFITGMPRSGTTLTENILAVHPDVFGGGELLAGAKILEEFQREHATSRRPVADILNERGAQWRKYYLENLPSFGDASVVTDKLPINFRAAPLLASLFPDAVFLMMRRRAVDVGLSIYRHQFPKAYSWTHRLDDIAHYYHQLDAMVDAWTKLAPTRIHAIDYHRLVDDPDREIRSLVDIARLPWDDACLEPHTQKRTVATFSSVASREPISRKSSSNADLFTDHIKEFAASLPS